MTIEPKVGYDVYVAEMGNGKLSKKFYSYHTVFRDNYYVYDPRLSLTPIPRGDFQSIITKLNPNGVKVFEGDPCISVKVERRGKLQNKVTKI